MKIVGVCGSPRKGNSKWMLERVLEGANASGADVELILLGKMNITLCDGCLTCEETGTCHFSDDMQEVYSKLLSCDAFVLGTPTYFDAVSSLSKVFIDRLNPLCDKLKGKGFAAVVAGQLSGVEGINSRKKVIKYLQGLAEILELEFIGFVDVAARNPKDASVKTSVRQKCDELGKNLGKTRVQKK